MAKARAVRVSGRCHRWFVRVAVFHAVGFAFDDDGLGAVQETVENRGGGADVIVEDRGPVFVDLIGRDDQRAPLVTLAHDLEEQVRPRLVQGQVTHFVEDEQRR